MHEVKTIHSCCPGREEEKASVNWSTCPKSYIYDNVLNLIRENLFNNNSFSTHNIITQKGRVSQKMCWHYYIHVHQQLLKIKHLN